MGRKSQERLTHSADQPFLIETNANEMCGLQRYAQAEAPTCMLLRLKRSLSSPKRCWASSAELQQVMELDLTPHVNLAAADPAAVMNSIESRGFYLQLPPGAPTDTC